MNIFDSFKFDEQKFNGSKDLGPNSDDLIVFNNYGLQNANIITTKSSEDEGPGRDIRSSENPNDDGKKIELDRFPQKVVTLDGLLTDTTAELVETRLDEAKKFLSEQNGSLKITRKGGEIRNYTATVQNLARAFDRERRITTIPFRLEFLCTDPFAKSTDRVVSSFFAVATSAYNFEIENNGSYKAKPIFSITIDTASNLTVINLKNNNSGKEIEISKTFAAGEELLINAENKTVCLDGVEIEFDGFFFDLLTGANSITATFTSSSHSVTISEKHFLTNL